MDVTATVFNKSVPCKILDSTLWLLQLKGLPSPLPQVKGKDFMQEGRKKRRIFNYNLPLASHVLFKTSVHPNSQAWQAVQSESRTGSAHA